MSFFFSFSFFFCLRRDVWVVVIFVAVGLGFRSIASFIYLSTIRLKCAAPLLPRWGHICFSTYKHTCIVTLLCVWRRLKKRIRKVCVVFRSCKKKFKYWVKFGKKYSYGQFNVFSLFRSFYIYCFDYIESVKGLLIL